MAGTEGLQTPSSLVAYHAPNAKSDLSEFSKNFNLPEAVFDQQYATTTHKPPKEPPKDKIGWTLETAMDIELAHAMAPNAKIILVEAENEDTTTSLMAAEDLASDLVAKEGGGVVSNSWSAQEIPGSASLNKHFSKPGVVYVAASGDYRAIEFPASSDRVIAVGGTVSTAFFV